MSEITLNKSFARRIGKNLSLLSQNLIDNYLPKFYYNSELLTKNYHSKVFMEIGFGMGEHFLNQTNSNQDHLFIGVEVYLNGVANILRKTKELELSNFLIWPDDLDLIVKDMPNNSLDGIYILFPDPWHKRRHRKKRLFNELRYKQLKQKLKPSGFIAFASDIDDYFTTAKEIVAKDFSFVNNDNLTPHENYIITKYHQKAINEGRVVQFFKAIME